MPIHDKKTSLSRITKGRLFNEYHLLLLEHRKYVFDKEIQKSKEDNQISHILN